MLIKPQRELIKKIITATAALTISLGATAQVASAAAYSDVYEGDWYYNYVQDASNKGVVSGYEDNTFRPANTITLGECLKMVLNYKGITCEKGVYHWASNYWDKAHEMSLVVWGEFENPDVQLSRQQVARIVVRALDEDYVNFDTSLIPDYKLVGDDYKQYVAQAYAKGIITGFEDGSFIGDKAITRAEILSILERAFNPSSRVALDTSNRKTDIAYVRKDIDIRVNGIHTAITDKHREWRIVQKGDEIYIPSFLFDREIGANYCSYTIRPCYTDVNYVSDSMKKTLEEGYYNDDWVETNRDYQWLFRNDWQVTNEVTPCSTSPWSEGSVQEYKEVGIDVNSVGIVIDKMARYSLTFLKEHGVQVEYDAENRVVYLGEKEIKLYRNNPDGTRNSVPIVSVLEDPNNCTTAHGRYSGGCGFQILVLYILTGPCLYTMLRV